MSRHHLTVVLSQAQGKHPAKRALEEALVAALIMEPGLDVSVVPHLYDLDPEHTGRLFLESVPGDMVVLSWLFPRAAFWLLDRDGIYGSPRFHLAAQKAEIKAHIGAEVTFSSQSHRAAEKNQQVNSFVPQRLPNELLAPAPLVFHLAANYELFFRQVQIFQTLAKKDLGAVELRPSE